MFTSIIGLNLTLKGVLICSIISILLGIAIAFIYMREGGGSKQFSMTLAVLPIVVQVVIMMVNGNLGTGVAVAGAFSLVRFRSLPGTSKEILYIFLAMAIGLATGMGHITFAVMMMVIIGVMLIVLEKTKFGEVKDSRKELKVTIPEHLDYIGIFDDLFEKFTTEATLNKVKTVNLGSMYELHYNIALKDETKEKEFIDGIRCRNGNLNIVCSRMATTREQL